MQREEDISHLIADREFQKILSGWKHLDDASQSAVLKEYNLNPDEIELLLSLWYSLDFKPFNHPEEKVNQAYEETLWKLHNDQAARNLPDTRINTLYQYFTRVAAILLLPLLLYAGYLRMSRDQKQASDVPQMVTVTSQAGTVSKLTLPDGSKVYLNSCSSVSYPTSFDAGERLVSLKGEAYFEVVTDKTRPMVVSAGAVSLKVYGTSFNVNSSVPDKIVRVTLVEGSISLKPQKGKIMGTEEMYITPGQTVTYLDNSHNVVVQNDDTFLYTAWKDGLIIFRNNNFENVLKQLSAKFNVDIVLKDKSLASIPLVATFRDENINEILRLLSLSTPFRYYYDLPQKQNDGTYQKSKIYIERQ